MFRRWRAGAAVLVAVLVAGPFAPAAQAQDNGGKVLRVALVQEIDHLNPFLASFASSTMVGRLAWEFLTLPSAQDNTPSPGLAESWSTSPDKLTWTYKIRQGVKWSDGQPVTAKDAAFTFNRIMTDEKAQEANGTYVENFASVTAPDDATLVITTKVPQASMTAIDVPIVPEHVWAGISDMEDAKTDSVPVVGVGDGPFLITEYRPNELVRLKANPDYWRGKAKYDELQFISYKNSDAAVNALKNNEVDLVNRLTPTQFDTLNGQPGITTNKATGRRYRELLINPGAQNAAHQPLGDGNPALKDVRVRRAIAQAIDPQTLIDKVLGGYGQLGGGIVPAAFPLYHWDPSDAQRDKFDPAAAGAALDAAGYPKGADGTRVGPDGKPLQLRLLGRASEDFSQRAADYVVSWLGAVGIKVTKQLVSDNEVQDRTDAGTYDLAFSGWGTSPDPDYVLSKQACSALPTAPGSSSSAAFFCDPQFDALYQQESAELDQAKRADLVKQAQARYYDQVPSLVLDYDNPLEAYRSDRFTSFPKQPANTGNIMEQSGYWSFYGAVPAEGGGSGGGGLPAGAWIGIGAAVLVVVVAGGVVVGRRKKTADDRE
ncbi:peptide/nickel transport system substrate-binding protein [Amycolatopsis bartoniae]|uniref:Peptide ABC transporter substrate-binding protein n=1 Tax=Amycolatopsis bartoniae TaxID=941986 RepID=A0A8H9IV54_9PSEU|nr:ABC transporter substrate-binding protein [Amycolatopsis bartoniae]MBB2938242.1 peptide/nickel transport system substrate-binding protein [Amycolatopsis bartoniae]TVT09020.1 ABC transporter substrate-binding protein [Amycolatopsis bartoniae]GHF33725.1 peptide ABC transporter substrate-binding protein [Amycolatopsis bartoniae]